VCLRLFPKGRRVYAYLRWYDGGRTVERYLGQVNEPDRWANLAAAWRFARCDHASTTLAAADPAAAASR
jgi:DNA mismatch endonuclease (patch repair protein)